MNVLWPGLKPYISFHACALLNDSSLGAVRTAEPVITISRFPLEWAQEKDSRQSYHIWYAIQVAYMVAAPRGTSMSMDPARDHLLSSENLKESMAGSHSHWSLRPAWGRRIWIEDGRSRRVPQRQHCMRHSREGLAFKAISQKYSR